MYTLQTIIQEAFQCRLNATANTAGHHGYTPALPHQQNAFGMLGSTCVESYKESINTVATQVAVLTYQSHTAKSSQCMVQQFVHLASQQNLLHENMHQIIAQVNTLSFNQSNAGSERLASNGNGRHGRSHGWHMQGVAPTVFKGGQFGALGSFAPATGSFAPGTPPRVMPYGGMPQGRGPPQFFADGPPVGIPHGG
jgi:hypothetical protein